MFEILHNEINKPLLLYLNGLSSNEIISKIIFFLADSPIFFIPVFLIVFWFYYNKKSSIEWKKKLLNIFFSTILAISISIFIQLFVSIDRPENSLENKQNLILEHIPDKSFPSDHASVSIAFLVSLYLFWYKKTFFIILPFFLLMNLSRIIWWIHWPFDVIVWSIVWIISAFIIYKIKNFIILNNIQEFLIKIWKIFKL